MQPKDPILAYLELARQRPELFVQNELVPIVLDEGEIRAFSARTGRPMGLVYDNSPFYLVVADLCLRGEKPFSYARLIYPHASNGSVAVPRMGGKFGLLRQFRHVPRREGLEFPRGFAGAGLSPEENIRRELGEEMAAQVTAVRRLGRVGADTGVIAGCAEVFLAEVADARPSVGHEGIRKLIWVTEEELHAAVAAGEITDGFTLSALTLLRCADKEAER